MLLQFNLDHGYKTVKNSLQSCVSTHYNLHITYNKFTVCFLQRKDTTGNLQLFLIFTCNIYISYSET